MFDDERVARGAAYRELATDYPKPGWVEQDPEHVWTSTRIVIAEALAAAGLVASDLTAIGIANQRSSLAAWDAGTLEPLSALISWQDVQAGDSARVLAEQGFIATPNMALTKADWIVHNIPAAAAAAAAGRLALGGVESWICARLTGGVNICDHGSASTTGLYAHLEGKYEARALEAIGVSESSLPRMVDSAAVVAVSTVDAIGAAVPIAGICGDQQSSLFGLGCRERGQAKCTFGTAAMINLNSGSDISMGGAGTYPLVAWRNEGVSVWCVEAAVITAGAAVQWLRDALGVLTDSAQSAALAASVADTGGVWAVPAFQGIGAPLMKPDARAAIGGLSRGSGRAHIVRAVLEGVAHRVADAAETVWETGYRPDTIRADGGASRNDFLMQLQADFLGIPVERSDVPDGAAVGAAALAAMATGVALDGWAAAFSPDRVFEPGLDETTRLELRNAWKKRCALIADNP